MAMRPVAAVVRTVFIPVALARFTNLAAAVAAGHMSKKYLPHRPARHPEHL
jgi:putative Ca2+/H+ antiporter (TMEM165/GDT1 family)